MIDETMAMKQELQGAVGTEFYSNMVQSIYPKKGARLIEYNGGNKARYMEIKTGKILTGPWRVVWNSIFY